MSLSIPLPDETDAGPAEARDPLPLVVQRGALGLLDLEPLEASAAKAGDDAVLAWLRQRLSGRDPYLPLGDMEPPYSLFVALARRLSADRPLRQQLDRCLAILLDEAWDNPPSYLAELLSLIKCLCPATCLPRLRQVAMNRRFSSLDYKERRDQLWLSATAAYPDATLLPIWLEILAKQTDPAHAHIAYLAVARDPELALVHLPALFHVLTGDERTVLIEEAVKDAHERFADRERFLARVTHHLPRYRQHPGLVELVAESMQALGLPLPREVLDAPPEPTPPTSPPAACRASYAGSAAWQAKKAR